MAFSPKPNTSCLEKNPRQRKTLVEKPKEVHVKNKYGENLVGVLHETGSAQVVILCHGYRSKKDSPIIQKLAKFLTKEGISVFRFDFSGNGESKQGTFQYGNYTKEADDLHSVVLHFVGMKRAVGAIVGHSKGGDVVLVYASKYHDVPAVLNISGRYNMERGIEEHLGKDYMDRMEENGFIDIEGNDQLRVTKESLMERLDTDMHALCLSIGMDCRVLTVHGSEDEIVPVEDAFEFAKVIAKHKLHIVEGANHCYTKHPSELREAVVQFIKESLQENDNTLH